MGSGAGAGASNHPRVRRPRKSGKPQNLDLLPSSYIDNGQLVLCSNEGVLEMCGNLDASKSSGSQKGDQLSPTNQVL